MAPSLILLAGAPEAKALDWQHSELLSEFSEQFARFAALDTQASCTTNLDESSLLPAWRSIPLERQHLPTGHSQNHGWQEDHQGADFFTTNSFVEAISQNGKNSDSQATTESVDQVLSQFYEESYAVHEDIASSQLAPISEGGTSWNSETSFGHTQSSFDSPGSGPRIIPNAGQVASLISIPNAGYLESIYPQTMTVNLIVGIISIPEPRSVKTRRGDNVDLIEILAGDETKSGFGVNFWLSSSKGSAGDLRDILTGLRPQDVVLLRNVALNSFRGKVYGQSLRKEMTKAHLLYRNKIERTDIGGCYRTADLVSTEHVSPQLEKTRRVREWVLKFVGGASKNAKAQAINETLPPDTQ